jgi:hypothetical protein
MKEQKAIEKMKDDLLPDTICDEILKDPEYIKYCNYYNILLVNDKKSMMGFCVWKSFGLNIK